MYLLLILTDSYVNSTTLCFTYCNCCFLFILLLSSFILVILVSTLSLCFSLLLPMLLGHLIFPQGNNTFYVISCQLIHVYVQV